jgi:hypothetical protein
MPFNEIQTLTSMRETLANTIAHRINEACGVLADSNNPYGLTLVDISSVEDELLADGYPVTHLNGDIAIANGHHYSLHYLIESEYLVALCNIVDVLTQKSVESEMTS